MTERYFTVGQIVNTHGLRGEVKVVSRTDFPELRFAPGSRLFIQPSEISEPIPVEVEHARSHKSVYLVKFKTKDHINEVEAWKGSKLIVHEDGLAELGEDEFYYHDIIGCRVFDEEGKEWGAIAEILHPGANDVWVVRPAEGKDILVPYIEDVVLSVDVDTGKVIIRPMEGMV